MRKIKQASYRIMAAVSARSNGVTRTEEECECRKKWKDVKSATLKSDNEHKKTGGGGPVKQCVYADVVFAIIGDSTVVEDGIEGTLINFCFTLYSLSLSLCLSLSLSLSLCPFNVHFLVGPRLVSTRMSPLKSFNGSDDDGGVVDNRSCIQQYLICNHKLT